MRKTNIIYLFLFLSSVGFSQTEKLIVPSDLKQQTIVTEPVTLRKGYLRIGVLADYRVADRFFNSSGDKEYYRTSSWGSKSAFGITLQYGISDRLQIDLFSDYMKNLQQTHNDEIIAATNKTETILTKQKGLGLGDSHLYLKYQIIREKENKFSLTGRLILTIPTGEKNPTNIKSENQYDLPVGDGTYALGINISARKVIYPYSFSGYLSYTKNFNGKKIFNTNTMAENSFRLGNMFETGVTCNFHLNEWIVFGNEINLFTEGQGKIETQPPDIIPASWAISYVPSIVFQVHRFRLSESAGIPLKGLNVPADPLYIMMVQFIF